MTPSSTKTKAHTRIGFTLIEVLIALALTVMIISVIGGAIRLYTINLEKIQQRIERTQVARSVLQMVSNDLRAAIQYKPADVTGLQELLESQAAIVGAAGAMAGGGTGEGEAGGGETGEGSESGEEAPEVEEEPVEPEGDYGAQIRPGIYGTQTQILIDTSRLPRIDQYNPIIAANENSVTLLPTDIKSVGYYVDLESEENNAIKNSQTSARGGLFRREIDRAVAVFANDTSLNSDTNTKLIATEIVEISFRYFDGDAWANEWDSDQNGGFPSAIEVIIVVDPNRTQIDPRGNYVYGGYDPEVMKRFRTVVHLPVAEMLSAEDLELLLDPTGASNESEDESTGESSDSSSGEESDSGAGR